MPLTAVEIVAAPSSSQSASAPFIDPVGAPDLSNIPSGGPKRGHGGPRREAAKETKGGKGKKKVKGSLEMQKL